MLRPFSLLGEGFAWYSIEGSLSEFRHIAHVSAQMSQDHIATAFHFFISNLIVVELAPAVGATVVMSRNTEWQGGQKWVR